MDPLGKFPLAPSDMQTCARNCEKGGYEHKADHGQRAENDLEEFDMGEILEHLSEIERMSSKNTEARNCDAEQCLAELEQAGWYDTMQKSSRAGDGARGTEVELPEGDALEDEWKETYKRRKAAWKLEAKQSEDVCGAPGAFEIGCIQDVEMVEEADAVLDGVGLVADLGMEVVEAATVMREIVGKWMLNTEQQRAFEIVAHHTAMDKPDQLLMYLGGPGGTGKSRVVNALREFFGVQNEMRRFRLAAYTGVAARNIGGATLHALLQMNDSGWQTSAKAKKDLAAMWEGVDYLFIDEVSMIGCKMMHNISHALTEVKGKTEVFSGVNVIFVGDFAQLPPIGDVWLYKDVDTTRVAARVTNWGQAKVLGRLLWLSVETVVILHEAMWQAGSGNTAFVDLLQRLRSGVCTDNDYMMLRGRALAKLVSSVDDQCRSAPVIVSNNAVRDAINRRATEAFAVRTGRELHWYHAVDTHKRTLITDPALIESLEGQHSGQTGHRLRRIPLVLGMPVAVNQNFDVRAGVVNGSWGYLCNMWYSVDDGGRRHLKCCVVEIPGSDPIGMPHLPAHHFPILLDTTDITFEHRASHKCCVIKRKQVPVEPGFAVTTHKAQGQMMDKVVVDLAGCSGTEQPYVMVSKSTSIEGLIVLHDFAFNQITKRRSEDLRKEFSCLECLRLQTIMKHGSYEEGREARGLLGDLKSSDGVKKRKWAAGEGQTQGKKARKERD